MRRLTLLVLFAFAAGGQDFHFALIGDRTGETVDGVFQKVLAAAAKSKPAFFLTVGDTIQGLHDDTAEPEWQAARRLFAVYPRIPLYLTPGNHDIWSAESERLYVKYARHPVYYSFDYQGAHFAVVDNSRSDSIPAADLEWLERDLREHESAPVKMVISHRPSWILDAMLGAGGPLHRLAKQYGVCCMIAGHVHQLIHAEMEGVVYYDVQSAGGHLRLSAKYEDGWFFGWTNVQVKGREVTFTVHSLDGEVTPLSAWGRTGLVGQASRPVQ